jgi:hypothetical protein
MLKIVLQFKKTAILNHGYVAVLKSTEGNINPEWTKYKIYFLNRITLSSEYN